MFDSGPRPVVRQMNLTTTWSATSMKSLIGSVVCASHASRSCPNQRMTASWPTKGPGSGQSSEGRMTTLGSNSSGTASQSPAFHASKAALHDLHVLLRHRPRSIPPGGAPSVHCGLDSVWALAAFSAHIRLDQSISARFGGQTYFFRSRFALGGSATLPSSPAPWPSSEPAQRLREFRSRERGMGIAVRCPLKVRWDDLV